MKLYRFILGLTIVAILAIVGTTLFAADKSERFNLNISKSTLKWVGSKVIGASHNGTVDFSNGFLLIDKGNLIGGEFTVDMNTIVNIDQTDKTYNDKLIGHLKSEDFFNVAKYPLANFKITKIQAKSGVKDDKPNYNISGDMTIKGKTNQIKFPVFIKIVDGNVYAKAIFEIDRTKWDIKYGSGKFFDNLGDKIIKDAIAFTIDANFAK